MKTYMFYSYAPPYTAAKQKEQKFLNLESYWWSHRGFQKVELCYSLKTFQERGDIFGIPNSSS